MKAQVIFHGCKHEGKLSAVCDLVMYHLQDGYTPVTYIAQYRSTINADDDYPLWRNNIMSCTYNSNGNADAIRMTIEMFDDFWYRFRYANRTLIER
jgi:hypothetical protein